MSDVMRQGMAAVLARKRHDAIDRESDRIVAALGTSSTPQRCTIKVARRLLINAPYQYNGAHFDVTAKLLGAGIYEIARQDK